MFSASTPSTSLSKATIELSSAHIVPQRPQLHSAAKSIFDRRKNTITDRKTQVKQKNKNPPFNLWKGLSRHPLVQRLTSI
jgi:hypothetical protein